MSMVLFKNENTGEMKEVKLGFSWTIFFFGSFFGIPFFLRRLDGIGITIIVSWVLTTICSIQSWRVDPYYGVQFDERMFVFCLFINFCVCAFIIILSFTGNKLGAQKLLEFGFKIVEKDETRRSFIKDNWELDDTAFLDNNQNNN